MAKTTSDAQADNKPKSLLEKVITSTPVVMAVIATILAGLSSGESNQSQYFRAMAAQHQSKAGDQWSYFQAKKTRSAMAGQERMRYLGFAKPMSEASIAALQNMLPGGGGEALKDAAFKEAILALNKPLAKLEEFKCPDAGMQEIYQAIARGEEKSIDDKKLARLSEESIDKAMELAKKMVKDADDQISPVLKSGKVFQDALEQADASAMKTETRAGDAGTVSPFRQLVVDFTTAKLRFESARLEREAKLNQNVATLFEVTVAKSTIQSRRARTRSQYFFYGMLAAQAAVTIATMSLAVRDKNRMWGLAAGIGLIAVGYGAYIYVYT